MYFENYFPALKALQVCHSNHPAMDKFYFLVHCADCALKKLFSMLDDECLFCSLRSSALTGCDEELDEVFGETEESNYDES